jgi:hypothetical protein
VKYLWKLIVRKSFWIISMGADGKHVAHRNHTHYFFLQQSALKLERAIEIAPTIKPYPI